MINHPLVSICVPIYNVEQYVERCCCSLFEQSYENIEYIFVDDCSPDDSVSIIKKVLLDYPERSNYVKIVTHEKNRGLSGSRNSGIDASNGYFLLFVDGDDFIDSQTVELLVEKAGKDDSDVVIYDSKHIYKNKSIIPQRIIPPTKEEVVKHLLTYKLGPSVWGKLYKASLIKDNKIRFVEGLNVGEDYCTSPRFLYYANKVSYCSGCYYNYIKYNETSYTNNYRKENIEDMIRAVSILDDFFKSKEDYQLYANHLQEAHLIVKVRLLSAICTHRTSVWHLIPMVSSLYSELKQWGGISKKYKSILWLANCKCYNILYLYFSIAVCLKKIIKN